MKDTMEFDFSRYTSISSDHQELLFARNCLHMARSFLKQKEPLYRICASVFYATAEMIYLEQKKRMKIKK